MTPEIHTQSMRALESMAQRANAKSAQSSLTQNGGSLFDVVDLPSDLAALLLSR